MVDPQQDSDTNDTIDRRTILKGTAIAGFTGAGLTGAASAQSWKELRFDSVSEELFSYTVSVSGELKRAPNRDGGDELVDENTARGRARGGNHDDWYFTGEITQLQLSGPGKVYVDGELVEDTTDDDGNLPNTVTVESKGEKVNYRFRVGGDVEKAGEAGGTDEIDDGLVRGTVGTSDPDDEIDTYRYSGGIAFDDPSGPLSVTLDFGDE